MARSTSTLFALVGPTASGKGEIARRIAPRMGAEIISVDSMKIFRGMDTCTAKPPRAAREEIPHHLIDIVDPWESFSVADWIPLCEKAIRSILERGRLPLLVVGTPLYLRSLMAGIFDGPSARWDLRDKWKEEARKEGPEVLHRRLEEIDPVTARRTHPNDLRRVIRALEVHAETGQPLSRLQEMGKQDSPYDIRMAGILWEREALHDRIERRVLSMFERGLVEEVTRLRQSKVPMARPARQAVGIKEVGRQLDGESTQAEAIVQMQQQTRKLARHQMTWFRKFPEIRWLAASQENFPHPLARDAQEALTPEG